MAINLPHHLAEVVNLLGFNWPEIDEDQLKDAAREVRRYAHECQTSHDVTHKMVTGDLPQVYQAQSYSALAEMWAGQTQGHMKTLIEVCHGLADAMVVIADAVTAMKYACITQLGIAAAELIGDAVGSVATLGLSDAAALVQVRIQQGAMNDIISNFVSTAESTLVNKITGPFKEQLDHAVEKLLFAEVAHTALGGPGPSLKVDTAAMRAHGDSALRQAEDNLSGGRALRNRVTSMTFTTGG